MKKSIIIILVLLFPSLALFSQTDTLVLTRKSSLEIAIESNPTIAIARLEKARAEARLNQTRGSLLPSLNASGSYTRNLKKQVIFLPEEMAPIFGGSALEVGNDNAFMGGVQLAMPLYNPAVYAGIDAARAEQRIADENFRNQAIDLTFNVQRAWFDVLLAKESLEVIGMSFQNANENLDNIRKLHNQGLVAEFDLIRAQVQTENLRPDLLQAQNMYELSLNLLKTLLGIDYDVVVEIEGNLMDSSEEMLSTFNIVSAERSLNNNPTYINLGLQRELVLRQAQSVRATALPSLAAFTNYMYVTEANNLNIRDYNWINTASAGLQLSVPIFRGFTTRNQVKQLEIGAQQLQLQREYLKDNLSIELSNVLKNMEVAMEKTTHAQKNVDLAQRGYDISRVRYQSGQGTLLEINDSEIALRRARFNLLMAKHELLQARVQYDRLTGALANNLK